MRGLILVSTAQPTDNSYDARCRQYAQQMARLLRGRGLVVDVAELPSDRNRIVSDSKDYAFVLCFTHGRDRGFINHQACPVGAPSDDDGCGCLSADGRAGSLSAREIVERRIFSGARIIGVTCCWAANHFGTTLVDFGGVELFIGYLGEFRHADVYDLFRVADEDDPFWLVARGGALQVLDREQTAEAIHARMLSLYAVMMEVYSHRGLDKWSRRFVYACLLNNLRGLAIRT